MKKIMNVSKDYRCFNLDPLDEKGKHQSIHLLPKDTSRELSEDEFNSREILEAIQEGETKGKKVIKVIDVSGSLDSVE